MFLSVRTFSLLHGTFESACNPSGGGGHMGSQTPNDISPAGITIPSWNAATCRNHISNVTRDRWVEQFQPEHLFFTCKVILMSSEPEKQMTGRCESQETVFKNPLWGSLNRWRLHATRFLSEQSYYGVRKNLVLFNVRLLNEFIRGGRLSVLRSESRRRFLKYGGN